MFGWICKQIWLNSSTYHWFIFSTWHNKYISTCFTGLNFSKCRIIVAFSRLAMLSSPHNKDHVQVKWVVLLWIVSISMNAYRMNKFIGWCVTIFYRCECYGITKANKMNEYDERAGVGFNVNSSFCVLFGLWSKEERNRTEQKKNWKTFNANYIVDVTDANGVYIDGNVIEILRYFRS